MKLKTDWFFPNMESQSMTRNCHNINIVMPRIAYKIAPNFLETVGTNGTSTSKVLLGSAPATWLALTIPPGRTGR